MRVMRLLYNSSALSRSAGGRERTEKNVLNHAPSQVPSQPAGTPDFQPTPVKRPFWLLNGGWLKIVVQSPSPGEPKQVNNLLI